MEILTCRTPGHEDKPQHGKTGLCQACYRRSKRQERGLRKPGPKPDPTKPYSRLNPDSKHYQGGSLSCGSGHRWEEGSHLIRSDGKKVCLVCIEERKGDLCAAGLHDRATNANAYGQCRVCARERKPARDRLAKYGITPEKLDEMLAEQDYSCKLCRTPFDLEAKYPFAVDHDHACCPGERTCGQCIRGLLCFDCNKGLGCFKDDVARLLAAVDYLLGQLDEPGRDERPAARQQHPLYNVC